ncbi:MAG: hypothetical protein ACTS6H_01575 [Candidatus Hodgkinia cicadicola]
MRPPPLVRGSLNVVPLRGRNERGSERGKWRKERTGRRWRDREEERKAQMVEVILANELIESGRQDVPSKRFMNWIAPFEGRFAKVPFSLRSKVVYATVCANGRKWCWRRGRCFGRRSGFSESLEPREGRSAEVVRPFTPLSIGFQINRRRLEAPFTC